MKVSIVACGESARNWNSVPVDLSIGVNDCFKFGHQVDNLLLINDPSRFKPRAKNNHTDRLSIITSSQPKKVYSDSMAWAPYFKGAYYEKITIQHFVGKLRPGVLYHHNRTSPFTAITLAVKLGASEIIVWGVDFKDHAYYNTESKVKQVRNDYLKLIQQVNKSGVKVWSGSDSLLSGFVNKYED